jgi:hypothetical protein
VSIFLLKHQERNKVERIKVKNIIFLIKKIIKYYPANFVKTNQIIQNSIENKNHPITIFQNLDSQNLQAIIHFTRLFDITAIIIVILATNVNRFHSFASTDIV